MITSLMMGMLGGAGILGSGYGLARKKLQREPFTAITELKSEKEQNEQRSEALSKKEAELKKKEKSLNDRSEFLDKRYQDIVDDDESNRQIADYYNELIQKEDNEWKDLQSAAYPKKGENAVLELVKRDASSRSVKKGYYKYLHDHRNALNDTRYGIFLEILNSLSEEFVNSEYKTFAINMYRNLSREGYNPYVISWIIMISLHSL
ncbi:hypothetical protein [Limosilactobacillus agrestis]|uniref:hypothetical protein n=1 Tax=Limosilactobacillus agrestis TaxID=2759748 RepID=UPI001E42EB46|nr:hypothetical protein [Limosilactobacillus agrestis]MCD7112264.1 hypothetical protein [Limosilactobacillus agrestis]